ncbi:methionyl-tRNA formyltransferase [Syntrophus gentianae]|uniref:Methionyl-tRNA formyltransferase n=1 Tax=Syntrophus gentianae TaxID=43775 RepID=A0A1H7VBA5_9BACT|nr:methionyl-tRNA formyltransferase [Syntrophus gentianae]SEM06542.1 methionyl-tRNA formyltransferase [Syntrophus gentianae]
MPKPTLMFMGTPEFALPSLEKLVEKQFEIVAVVTQPDRPKGRGKQLMPPPVKEVAIRYDIPVLQPQRVKEPSFMETLKTFSPDLIVVAAFGQILPREVLNFPPLGCINVHPSLLPKYRGAAPLNWTLINGETNTGVTIMYMDEGLDTGDILLQEATPVDPEETFGHLHDRLAALGADLLISAIALLEAHQAPRRPQEDSLSSYAPMLKKEDGLIRWDAEVSTIVNRIRGLSPAPCAYTFLDGKTLKIFAATGIEGPVSTQPGRVGDVTKEGLQVTAKNGYVLLTDIQMENRKRMIASDFLRGYKLSPDTILG